MGDYINVKEIFGLFQSFQPFCCPERRTEGRRE